VPASKPIAGTKGTVRPALPKGQRKGAAKFYDPPRVCAARGCSERLTIAAVVGGSRYCRREHDPELVPFLPEPMPKGPRSRSRDADEPDEAELVAD
jgi:hypothetical protein